VIAALRSRRLAGRVLDALAVALLLLAGWRFFIAPRIFQTQPARAAPFRLAALDGPAYVHPARPGKLTFLDFWASWCEPCKVSLPLVERFAAGNPDVRVVAVDVGEPPPVGAAYARANGLRNVVFDPDETVAHRYGIWAFPTIIVVDPDGWVRGRWEGLNPAVELAMSDARAHFGARRR
jgi:thiol-disulfide isomerase/thioredoxin